jgi:hypothetical protein
VFVALAKQLTLSNSLRYQIRPPIVTTPGGVLIIFSGWRRILLLAVNLAASSAKEPAHLPKRLFGQKR